MEWRIYALPGGIFPQGLSFCVFCGVAIDSIDLMVDSPEKVLGYVRGWLVDAMQEGEELYLQEPEDESLPAADFQRIP